MLYKACSCDEAMRLKSSRGWEEDSGLYVNFVKTSTKLLFA